MEGPGGYQFVGRTVPVWNRFRTTKSFLPGFPWLLRFFDQIRFYEVGAEELLELRRDILTGQFEPRIEGGEFSFREYQDFLHNEEQSIEDFRALQRRAFSEERERWREAGQDTVEFAEPEISTAETILEAGETPVCSPSAGSVWRLLVAPGDRIAEGQPVAILESMKMEINCAAASPGVVARVLVAEGKPVAPGQTLLTLKS